MSIPLLFCVVLGALLRVAFCVWGAPIVNGPDRVYTNADSFSYANAFVNLWIHGEFTHTLGNLNAHMGRLPGYPLFWGAHYVLAGPEGVYPAVAFTQCVIDVVAIVLVYSLIGRLGMGRGSRFLGAFLYSVYPFVIFWLPITGTEALASFLTILVWHQMHGIPTLRRSIWLGFLVAVAFYTREYLGILIVMVCVHLCLFSPDVRSALRNVGALVLVFGVLYTAWPVRNYLTTGRLVLIKPKGAGYAEWGRDVNAIRAWVYSWSLYPGQFDDIHEMILEGKEPPFPAEVFGSLRERQDSYALLKRYRECGSSYRAWKGLSPLPGNCDEEIAAGFDKLRVSFISRHPITHAFRFPLANLEKAFFKEGLLKDRGSGPVVRVLFLLRSATVVLGFLSLAVWRPRSRLLGMWLFPAFMYFYICFGLRQLEMRYLLQADITLLILCLPTLNWVASYARRTDSLRF